MRYLLAILLLSFSLLGRAELLIIVHADNFEALNENYVRSLYLGKSKTFPSGLPATAYDLKSEQAAFKSFIKQVLRRNENNLNAYWARMLFSSQGRPPERLASPALMLQKVSSDISAIGYIMSEDLDKNANVRIVLKIP